MPRLQLAALGPAGTFLAWVDSEVDVLSSSRPRLITLCRRATTRPMLSLVVMAAIVGGLLQPFASQGDSLLFGKAADQLFGAGGLDVFAAPGTQVGPLYLTVLALIRLVAHATHLPLWFTTGAIQSAAVCALALMARRSSSRTNGRSNGRDWALGLAVVAGGLLAEAVLNGHLEELATGLLLVLAGNRARQGSPAAAGLLVGLAGVLKLWGFLGIALLIVAVPRRTSAGSLLTVAAVGLAAYFPFFVFGTVHTFDFVWRISPSSSLGLLTGRTDVFDFRWRVGQAAAAVAFATFLNCRGARPVLVVAGLMAVRLALDPQSQTYYFTALVVVLLVAACSAQSRGPVASLVLAPLSVLAPYLAGEVGGSVLRTAALGLLCAVLFRSALRHPSPQPVCTL